MNKTLDILSNQKIESPRLTVTKERITMKFPGETDDKVVGFFHEVAEKIGNPETTLRGALREGRIKMETNDHPRKTFGIFVYENRA